MKRARFDALLAALGLAAALATGAAADVARGSAFALPIGSSSRLADPPLAQRVIDRDWGPSDDSIYVEVVVPEWRSGGVAMALSAVVPGAGQIYSGQRVGLLFMVAEAVGWFETWYLSRRGREIRDEALAYVGNPYDSLSRWTFGDYEQRTGRSTEDLQRIYDSDPGTFYFLISRDERYHEGWEDYPRGYSEVMREQYLEIHEDSEAHFKRSRYFRGALLVNHVLAALDAARAARLHNLHLSPAVKVGVTPRWVRGSPGVAAVIEGRF